MTGVRQLRIRLTLGGALAIAAFCPAGCRRDVLPGAPSFEMRDAWARATPDSGSTTAAYVRLVNGTAAPIVVSHFTSDDARVVELHESAIDASGEASMAERDSIVISPSDSLVMKPGGYHLMLIGTTHALDPGSMVRIVVRVSNGTVVSTSARVKS